MDSSRVTHIYCTCSTCHSIILCNEATKLCDSNRPHHHTYGLRLSFPFNRGSADCIFQHESSHFTSHCCVYCRKKSTITTVWFNFLMSQVMNLISNFMFSKNWYHQLDNLYQGYSGCTTNVPIQKQNCIQDCKFSLCFFWCSIRVEYIKAAIDRRPCDSIGGTSKSRADWRSWASMHKCYSRCQRFYGTGKLYK